MVKMSAIYQGEKHCELVHGPSGATVATDAPRDNHGKGESFSPTDLLSVSTGACMLTVMAIAAEKDGVQLKGSRVDVTKEMSAHPRRVQKLTVTLHLPQSVPHDYRKKLEEIALNCPVKLSLHPDIDMPVVFHFDI